MNTDPTSSSTLLPGIERRRGRLAGQRGAPSIAGWTWKINRLGAGEGIPSLPEVALEKREVTTAYYGIPVEVGSAVVAGVSRRLPERTAQGREIDGADEVIVVAISRPHCSHLELSYCGSTELCLLVRIGKARTSLDRQV